MERLFKEKEVNKFYEILDRMSRMTSEVYKDGMCEKYIFVRRALKPLLGKTFKIITEVDTGLVSWSKKLYRQPTPIKREIYQYLHISNIRFAMGHRDEEIVVRVFDAANPVKFDNEINFKFRSAVLNILGEELSSERFKEISDLFIVPEVNCDSCGKRCSSNDKNDQGAPECDKCKLDKLVNNLQKEK